MNDIHPNLTPFFHPRSVAVIGASSDPGKIGGRPIAYMKRAGYEHPIYPVNGQGGEVQGLAAYARLDDIPGDVDLVVVAVPASGVEAAVDACIAKRVRGIVMFSAGFAEVDEAGRLAQQALAKRCVEAGIRLLGPNCLGLFHASSRVFATFGTSVELATLEPGPIAFVSQSGALGAYLHSLATVRGIHVGSFIATGNESDLDVGDFVAYLANDPDTRAIMIYLEGSRNGPKLRAALRLAARNRKAVIAMKVGVSATGAAAAASHTGSLAGEDAVYGAVFDETGVHRAKTAIEMLEVAHACTVSPMPAGPRLGVVSVSGGAGVVIADAAAELGLVLPPLPADAQAEVKRIIPYASGVNPVDTTGQTLNDRTLFTRIMSILAERGGIDSLIAFVSNVGAKASEFAKVAPAFAELRNRFPDRVIGLCTRALPEVRAELERIRCLVFEDPSQGTALIAAMNRIARGFERAIRDPEAAGAARTVPPPGALDERAASELLANAGVAFAPARAAKTAGEAVAAARDIGFPVVLKILSPDIAHKSDIGGVAVGLADADAVARAWTTVTFNARTRAPEAKVEGVLVAKMLSSGVEVVIGANRDPVFGPMVMFGLGGVFVEVFRDVAFHTAPVGRDDAMAMIRSIRGLPLLSGIRGRAAVDLEAIATTIVRVSQFAAANRDWVASVEINPFIALPAGGFAVDALVVKA